MRLRAIVVVVLVLLAFIIIFLLLRPQPTPETQQPTVISLATWATGEDAVQLESIVNSINESRTDLQIVLSPTDSDYFAELQEQVSAGEGADLYWLDPFTLPVVAQSLLMPITECVTDAEPGTVGDLADYVPGILSATTINGDLYGLPWVANPIVTYYNRDIFDAYGIAYPVPNWTWDDFLHTAALLTMDTNDDSTADQWGFAANGWPPPHLFIWQAGGDLLSEDFLETTIDNPEVITGLNFYQQIAFNPRLSPDEETITAHGLRELFLSGDIAMYMGDADEDFDGLNIGAVQVPGFPQTGDHTTYAGTTMTVVNANVENFEATCAALLTITDALQQWKITSPRISHNTVEHIVNADPSKQDAAAAIMAATASMQAYRVFPLFPSWNSALWEDFLMPIIRKDIGDSELGEHMGEEVVAAMSLMEFAEHVRVDLDAILGSVGNQDIHESS